MCEECGVYPVYVRTNNGYGFRHGQWARLVDVRLVSPPDGSEARLCFEVEFIDGGRDQWVVYDAAGEYEFGGSISA